jgi:hypothetical protein
MKKCKICQETKPYDDFNKNSKTYDGYFNKCRICTKQYYANLSNGIRLTKEEKHEAVRESKVKGMENERRFSKELLKDIGYDVESELSIHQQFMLRHNLV